MAEPFKASLVKIDRAKKHIKEFEDMAADYWASEPVKVRFDPTPPDGMKTGFKFHFDHRAAPEEMSAVLGDVIHNLRSALDLMATELATLNEKSPKGVYFPFCDDAGEIDAAIKDKKFDRAGDEAVNLLKEMKPYKGGNILLRALHDFDIQDKHKMLIPTSTSAASPVFELHDGTGKYHTDEHGRPMPKIVGDPNKPSETRLEFPNDSVFAGKEIIPTLHDLVKTAAGTVEAFKALSAPTR